jgi:hypothetical protein
MKIHGMLLLLLALCVAVYDSAHQQEEAQDDLVADVSPNDTMLELGGCTNSNRRRR